MADPAIVKKIRSLMARATDPGASNEEQRTSAHVAAKLCKEHGIELGELGEPPIHERAEFTMNGVRTVIETIRSSRSGLDAVFGFDVFSFAQGILRTRAQEAITEAMRKPAPRRARPKPKK